ncbi:polyprenyl synthetase family protein [Sediminispirochaeta smaragdinae]|uniref:Polyprenyl synthetase n=1 Tax=Sediminispirochaeta smaragdinae (strain DSM 11293 / JCM 15392 / SEBR 4228) TaxID=573413 RepID=E1R5V9_SEDSS|nr:polyprenyl synthetase family protein [Sediminispirochaeta smaragdinae]ADK80724.1 Polyprenyl synthetase [Sediminispirochaeta smaragdinae DSM 11293]
MKQSVLGIPSLDSDLLRVREVILTHIRNSSPTIREGLEELILAQGKMLRPSFLLLTARCGKFSKKKAYDIAAAIEMLHIATLIHDDVIDDADTRRGVPAVHTKIGIRKAILMGDYLFSRCFSIAAQYATIENGRSLSTAVGFICQSEIDQSTKEYDFAISRRTYLRRIAGKTAALFLLSFHAGASQSKMNKTQVMWARRAGYAIGMAFQIIDDILDYTGSKEVLGKPAGSDLRQGVCTLPLIIARETKQSEEISALIQRLPNDPGVVDALLSIVEGSGALATAREEAQCYTDRAIEALDHLPANQAREQLLALTRTVLARSY